MCLEQKEHIWSDLKLFYGRIEALGSYMNIYIAMFMVVLISIPHTQLFIIELKHSIYPKSYMAFFMTVLESVSTNTSSRKSHRLVLSF